MAARGQPDDGVVADSTPEQDGGRWLCTSECTVGQYTGRMVKPEWPLGWYGYLRPRFVQRNWLGSLLEDQQDKGGGTLYRRNRYYDPATGRFTQEDLIGLAGGLNLYGFANGDPVNFSDPFGLCPKDAGGDGKTEGFADCPKGSSGYYANEDANGRGGFVNDVKGAAASRKESSACKAVAGVGALVTGGIIASEAAFEAAGATGEIAGFTQHGLSRVIQRGVRPGDILNAVRGGEPITQIDKLGRVSYKFVGEQQIVGVPPRRSFRLTAAQKDALVSILGDDLQRRGFGANYKPTAEGTMAESIIDVLADGRE